MRREKRFDYSKAIIRLEVVGVGIIEVDGATGMFASDTLMWAYRFRELFNHRLSHRAGMYVWRNIIARRRIRQYGSPDIDKAVRFLDMLSKAGHSGDYNLWINDRLAFRGPKAKEE